MTTQYTPRPKFDFGKLFSYNTQEAPVYWENTMSWYERFRETFHDNLPQLPPNSEILEVGCSEGEVSHELAEIYPDARIVAIEMQKRQLERARRNPHPRIAFVKGDAYDTYFPQASFDMVLAMNNVMFALRENGKVLKHIKDIGQLVKVGGYFAVSQNDNFAVFRRTEKGFDYLMHNTDGTQDLRFIGDAIRVHRVLDDPKELDRIEREASLAKLVEDAERKAKRDKFEESLLENYFISTINYKSFSNKDIIKFPKIDTEKFFRT